MRVETLSLCRDTVQLYRKTHDQCWWSVHKSQPHQLKLDVWQEAKGSAAPLFSNPAVYFKNQWADNLWNFSECVWCRTTENTVRLLHFVWNLLHIILTVITFDELDTTVHFDLLNIVFLFCHFWRAGSHTVVFTSSQTRALNQNSLKSAISWSKNNYWLVSDSWCCRYISVSTKRFDILCHLVTFCGVFSLAGLTECCVMNAV